LDKRPINIQQIRSEVPEKYNRKAEGKGLLRSEE
jgi:hypothetical protein